MSEAMFKEMPVLNKLLIGSRGGGSGKFCEQKSEKCHVLIPFLETHKAHSSLAAWEGLALHISGQTLFPGSVSPRQVPYCQQWGEQ